MYKMTQSYVALHITLSNIQKFIHEYVCGTKIPSSTQHTQTRYDTFKGKSQCIVTHFMFESKSRRVVTQSFCLDHQEVPKIFIAIKTCMPIFPVRFSEKHTSLELSSFS